MSAFFFIVIGVLLYCLYLAILIDTRFSGRRWSIPSKVYSDSTLLFPGQQLNRPLFINKLRRLEYRNIAHAPQSSGEMQILGSSMEVYLHDLEMPAKKQKGFPRENCIPESGN